MVKLPSNEKLAKLSMQLLEDAAFMFAEPAEESRLPRSPVIVARVTIGASGGVALILCIEEQLGVLLAANLLGVENDSEEAEKEASDAVGELANIMAGTLALEIGGKTTNVAIGIPVVKKELGTAIWKELGNTPCRVDLNVEDGKWLTIAIKPEGRL